MTKDEYNKALVLKLDHRIFRDFEMAQASDRTQEKKNFEYDEQLFNIDRNFMSYVTKDDLAIEMREKVSLPDMDELK